MGQFEMSGPKPEDENDTGEDEPEDKPVVEEKAEPRGRPLPPVLPKTAAILSLPPLFTWHRRWQVLARAVRGWVRL
jgi:hypothetical protein